MKTIIDSGADGGHETAHSIEVAKRFSANRAVTVNRSIVAWILARLGIRPEEGIPHHLLDVREGWRELLGPAALLTERWLRAILCEVEGSGQLPIDCGGTGLT